MSPPQSPPSSPTNLAALLSSSARITAAHSRHFLALSTLFLLPLSFLLSTSLRPLLLPHHHLQTLTLVSTGTNFPTFSPTTIILPFTCFILFTAAVGSVSFSIFHGFFGRPVKVVNALLHVTKTSPKLLSTSLLALLIQLGISISSLSLVFSLSKSVHFIGLNYNSVPFKVIGSLLGFVLVTILVYLNVMWMLASVVVVIEGRWGWDALKRSGYLVTGMRGMALSVLGSFGFFVACLAWIGAGDGRSVSGWRFGWGEGVGYVARTVAVTALLMIFVFNGVAANAVMYLYAKAGKGELAGEIAEEFAREYVCLPFDEGKVPHVVSVVPAAV